MRVHFLGSEVPLQGVGCRGLGGGGGAMKMRALCSVLSSVQGLECLDQGTFAALGGQR